MDPADQGTDRQQPLDLDPALPPAGEPDDAPGQQRVRVGGIDVINVAAAVAVAGAITLGVLYARGSAPEAAGTSTAVTSPEPAPAPAVEPAVLSLPAAPRWSRDDAVKWTGGAPRSYAFDVPARQDVSVWMRNVRPRLVVRCTSGEIEAFVFTESAAAIEADTEDHTVRYRFDGDPELVERWADSSEHDGLFAPLAPSFVERLKRAQTFSFGYTPHNAVPVTMQFDVAGLRDVLEPVEKGCVTPRPRGRRASAGRP